MCVWVHVSVCKPMRSLQHLLLQAHLRETPRTWSGSYGWNESSPPPDMILMCTEGATWLSGVSTLQLQMLALLDPDENAGSWSHLVAISSHSPVFMRCDPD